MKTILAIFALTVLSTTAHAECEKVITGSTYNWGMKENSYTIYCDDGAYQEDRDLSNEEASARLEKRQLQENSDNSPEAKARAEAINAEIEKERAMELVHPPISY